MKTPFRIALTADFYDESGAPRYKSFGLERFDGHEHIVVSKFSDHGNEIASGQLAGHHAALVLAPKVTAASLAGCEELLAISRFGVGYDSVDVEACTANHVLLTITPGAVETQRENSQNEYSCQANNTSSFVGRTLGNRQLVAGRGARAG